MIYTYIGNYTVKITDQNPTNNFMLVYENIDLIFYVSVDKITRQWINVHTHTIKY